jgi:radical SAM-linked protein
VAAGSAISPGPPEAVPTVARQRWRLVLARSAGASDLTGRDVTEAWEAAVEGSGLPLHRPAGRVRGRVAFGAPLPVGVAGERELADILLTDLVPAWRVRECLSGCLPGGWRLIDLFDVWLGAPPLAGQVAAADYRIELEGADGTVVTAAAAALLGAEELPRDRPKGTGVVRYDLRPLVTDVVVATRESAVVVHARTRFDPVRGTGRPEEVIAALEDIAGTPLPVGSIVRERLILADELT